MLQWLHTTKRHFQQHSAIVKWKGCGCDQFPLSAEWNNMNQHDTCSIIFLYPNSLNRNPIISTIIAYAIPSFIAFSCLFYDRNKHNTRHMYIVKRKETSPGPLHNIPLDCHPCQYGLWGFFAEAKSDVPKKDDLKLFETWNLSIFFCKPLKVHNWLPTSPVRNS